MVAKTKVIGQPLPPAAFLVARQSKRTGRKPYKLKLVTNKIGRDAAANDLILDDETVSAEHAVIKYENGSFVLYDLASRNGTRLNGNNIQRQSLMDGDVIQLGSVSLVFKEVKD